MTGTTPTYGLTYPTSGDPLKDAVTTIPHQLALDVESALTGFGGIAAPGSWVSVGGGGGAPAFASNWGNYGGAFQTVQYRKIGNQVQLRGLALRSSTTSSADATIFTLPSGFRPPADLVLASEYSAAGVSTHCRINVKATGVVTITQTVTATQYVSLNIPPFWID